MCSKTTAIRLAAALALVLLAGVVVAQSGAREIQRGPDARPGDDTGRDPLIPQFEVRWFALAGGGGEGPMTLGGWSASGTLGQVAIGRTGSLPGKVCVGFWCAWQRYKIYLPLILRNY